MSDPISDFLDEETVVKAADRLAQAELTPEACAILVGAQLIADAIQAHSRNEEYCQERLAECIGIATGRVVGRLENIYGEIGS